MPEANEKAVKEDYPMHEHTFDRRDTNYTRCLDCNQLVNDSGKMITLPTKSAQPLADWCNTLAAGLGINRTLPEKEFYLPPCTVADFGQ